MKKVCNTCKNEKLIEEFSFRNKNENQRHASCKLCYIEIRKKYYNNNKEKTKNKNNRLIERNRNWLVSYKSGKFCYCCDQCDVAVLDFHHLNNKKFNVVSMIRGYSIESIIEEIKKCVIVCSNCHRKIHYHKLSIDELKNINALIV